jgi:putative sterol carrier protein
VRRMDDSTPPIDAADYASLVRDATDAQLAADMRTNRDRILDRVFEQMAEHLDPGTSREAEAVVEWRITGRPDGGHDRYQVAIQRGTCAVTRDGDMEATVVYTIGPVEFIRLVTGNASGPELFMSGRLTVEGDLMLAAMVQSWFRQPVPPASAGA